MTETTKQKALEILTKWLGTLLVNYEDEKSRCSGKIPVDATYNFICSWCNTALDRLNVAGLILDAGEPAQDLNVRSAEAVLEYELDEVLDYYYMWMHSANVAGVANRPVCRPDFIKEKAKFLVSKLRKAGCIKPFPVTQEPEPCRDPTSGDELPIDSQMGRVVSAVQTERQAEPSRTAPRHYWDVYPYTGGSEPPPAAEAPYLTELRDTVALEMLKVLAPTALGSPGSQEMSAAAFAWADAFLKAREPINPEVLTNALPHDRP